MNYRENAFKEEPPLPERSWWSRRIREEKAFLKWLAVVPVLWGLWNLVYFVRHHEIVLINLTVFGAIVSAVTFIGLIKSAFDLVDAKENRKRGVDR